MADDDPIDLTRHWFGLGPADWTFKVGPGNTAVLVGGAELTMWSQPSAGLQYKDLRTEGGDAATVITSANGTSLPLGTIPRFQGPPGVTSMWADGGENVRYLLVATDLGDLVRRVTLLEQTVAAQQIMLSHAAYALKYDTGTAAYPDIPAELAGQKYLLWIGPPSPVPARFRDLHIPTKE